jgi:molybdopterin synthase catalytic subunit
VAIIRVQEQPISVDEALAAVRRPDCGAVGVFLGTVRNHHDGKKVVDISYSAFREMAEKELGRIVDEAKQRWVLGEVAVVHRVGKLAIGDISVLIAVSSPHRKESFEACRHIIETLKKTVPIWKEEFYETGKAWVSTE